jgi:hypothetical protein
MKYHLRFFLIGALCLTPAHAAMAAAHQETTGTNAPSVPARASSVVNNGPRQPTVTLTGALEQISRRTGVLVLADSTVAYERIAAGTVEGGVPPSSVTADAAETAVKKQLAVLVRSLPPGTAWGKVYLPAPGPGRLWKGDDVAAFVFAQARLFGTVGAPMADGGIEILGRRVSKEEAPRYIAGLELKPVYLLSNARRRTMALGAGPWSPATQEQWASMSKEERKRYGQEQAAWIMSLPEDQRAQMLKQIRQHDKYFDTVKDPLEKLLGHDL